MFDRNVRIRGLLVALLLAATAAAAQPAAQQPAAPADGSTVTISGDPARGARLYTGEAAFTNGGAPCLGCHGITGFGLAGGANYGPDLTGMFATFGAEGIADILRDLPFPSMEQLYASRPLAGQEQADLGAFFVQVSGVPVARSGLLVGEIVSGALIFFGVVLLFGRERLRGVREALLKRASAKKEVRA